MIRRVLSSAAFVSLAVAAALGVQQRAPVLPPPPDPDLVQVRVTVTGPAGKTLPRLQPSQFRLFEDGVEQRPTSVVFDDQPASVAIVWGILNDDFSAELRDLPLHFLQNLPKPSGARRGLGPFNLNFEYFLLEGGSDTKSPPTIRIAFSTDLRVLPRVYPKVRGSSDAVYVALDVLKEAAFPKKAVLLLADSIDEQGLGTDYYKATAIRQNVPIYAIMGGGNNNLGGVALQELIDLTGGEGYQVTSGGAAELYAKEVAQGLANQYLVGFHSTNTAKDGKWRKLRVRLDLASGSEPGTPKLKAKVKSGYYAARALR